jgi:hypothetical protein
MSFTRVGDLLGAWRLESAVVCSRTGKGATKSDVSRSRVDG